MPEQQDFDQNNRQAMAALVGGGAKLAGKLLKRFIVWLVSLLAPYLVPILAALFLAAFIYAVLFVVPRYIMESAPAEGADTQVVSIFNGGTEDTWTMEFDQELKRKYDELGSRWSDGLETETELRARLGPDWQEEIDAGQIISELDQAEPYRLPWSVLAGVDRVIGDPIINGQDTFLPQPDKNYAALKPEFTWQEATFTKTIEEEVEHTRTVTKQVQDKEVQVEETYTTIETRIASADVRLLQEVRAYDAVYDFQYKPETVIKGEQNKNQRITKLETVKTIRQSGPYFGPLINLLSSYGITKELDQELVLQLAMTYDPDYAADFNLLGIADYGFSIDLTKKYWQGPQGQRAAPLPLEYMSNVTSPFGMRLHPITSKHRFHSGLDLGAPAGTPIYAFQNGLVIHAGSLGSYGNAVIIDHGTFKTLYGHLSKIGVTKGQHVISGDEVGKVGSTGLSTGPHLHFEVQEIEAGQSVPVDPVNYLS